MLLTLAAFVFVLGILVFIHEFGHFIMAKIVGVRVERFSLGFPPRMIGKKIGDTDYCISWIPIGGYVKLSGMIDESMDADSIKGEPWEFMSKPAWKKFLIIFNGPFMNLLLTVVILALMNYLIGVKEPAAPTIGTVANQTFTEQYGLQYGDRILSVNEAEVNSWYEIEKLAGKSDQLTLQLQRGLERVSTTLPATFIDDIEKTHAAIIGEVLPESPAAGIGLQQGDIIISVDGQQIRSWQEMTTMIEGKASQEIALNWIRNGSIMTSTVTPVQEADKKARIGIGMSVYTQDIGVFTAISSAFDYSVRLTVMMYQGIKQVFLKLVPFKDAFGGPIMIAKMAGESARLGIESLLFFIALLSLNLGLLNLLPIPVLDGGHIIYLFIESIIRRPISPKVKLITQQIGMALLLAFMVFVIVNDIRRFL